MKKRFLISIFVVLMAAFLLAGCLGSSSPEPTLIVLSTRTPVPTQPVVVKPTAAVAQAEAAQTGSNLTNVTVKIVTGEYAPYTGESLPNKGMATDVLETVLKDLGWTYEIVFAPWDRGLQETTDGTVFGTFPYGPLEERKATFLFSKPLYEDQFLLFVNADSTLQYNTDEDLTGHSICYPAGDAWPIFGLQTLLDAGKIKMQRTTDLPSCFKMLQEKRVEMVFGNQKVALAAAKEALGATDGIKSLENPVQLLPGTLMVARIYPNAEQLVAAFDASLQKLEADGTLAAIREKHKDD